MGLNSVARAESLNCWAMRLTWWHVLTMWVFVTDDFDVVANIFFSGCFRFNLCQNATICKCLLSFLVTNLDF